MELENQKIDLLPGEFVIIPKGTPHRPVALQEVEVLPFEPATTINAGGEKGELTSENLEKI